MTDHPWDFNEDGHWCGCCGYLVAHFAADPEALPDECRECGFPDPEKVARFHYFDEDQDDFEEEHGFDCHMGSDGQCGAAGSEECEFECPTMRAWRRGDLS